MDYDKTQVRKGSRSLFSVGEIGVHEVFGIKDYDKDTKRTLFFDETVLSFEDGIDLTSYYSVISSNTPLQS